jgi:CO/xanthine dehydrogenase FAD-binding subunit
VQDTAMNRFDYIACSSIAEACDVLQNDGAQVIAGGTDLLITLRRPDGRSPALVVDITRIGELREIASKGGIVSVGALATHSEVARSGLLRSASPLLVAASSHVGSPQIRNRGTIGGNIMNAAACADTVPPLIALGALAMLVSATARRTVPLADLFEAPYRTRARTGELLTAVRFDPLPAGSGSAFLKLGRRNALSIARLSVAVVLVLDSQGVISEARIVPGAAVPVWRRFSGAEEILLGRKPMPALFTEAGKTAAAEMVAVTGRRWSTEYKEPVLAILVRRALETAASSIRMAEHP